MSGLDPNPSKGGLTYVLAALVFAAIVGKAIGLW